MTSPTICDVDPIFGTLADFDALIARAHALGLKVIIDQVYSHTSDEHAWFVDSRSSRTNAQGRLVCLGRCQGRWVAAVQLAVGVRRSGLDLGCAPPPVLHAQFPEGAAAAERAGTRRCRPPCWTRCGSGWTGASTASGCDALNFAMHDPQLTDNPPLPRQRQADPAVRLPGQGQQPVPAGNPGLPDPSAQAR